MSRSGRRQPGRGLEPLKPLNARRAGSSAGQARFGAIGDSGGGAVVTVRGPSANGARMPPTPRRWGRGTVAHEGLRLELLLAGGSASACADARPQVHQATSRGATGLQPGNLREIFRTE